MQNNKTFSSNFRISIKWGYDVIYAFKTFYKINSINFWIIGNFIFQWILYMMNNFEQTYANTFKVYIVLISLSLMSEHQQITFKSCYSRKFLKILKNFPKNSKNCQIIANIASNHHQSGWPLVYHKKKA